MKLLLVYQSDEDTPFLITLCDSYKETKKGRLIIKNEKRIIKVNSFSYTHEIFISQSGNVIPKLRKLCNSIVEAGYDFIKLEG